MIGIGAAGLLGLLAVFLLTLPQGGNPQPIASPSVSTPTATVEPSPTAAPVTASDGDPDSPNASEFVVAAFPRPGVFFVSSSLTLRCGILVDENGTEGLGRWGCFAQNHTWEFASAAPGDPCFEPPAPFCGGGIEAAGHVVPGPMIRGQVDESYASQWTVQDGADGYEVRTLAAGERLTYAGITCEAAQNNVITCTDTATGHGFTISSAVNTIF